MDETDVKILKVLLSNARLSYRQIAGKAGVSVGTVLSRVKKMEQEGLIHVHGTNHAPNHINEFVTKRFNRIRNHFVYPTVPLTMPHRLRRFVVQHIAMLRHFCVSN